MIRSFRHKGLKRFFETGSKAGVLAAHEKRLRLVLRHLDAAESLADLAFPGSGLHPLHGGLEGHLAIRVSGAWRITFRFEGSHVWEIDYVQYH